MECLEHATMRIISITHRLGVWHETEQDFNDVAETAEIFGLPYLGLLA